MDSTDATLNLYDPVEEDRILELRTGKMRKFDGINVMTGIFKTTHSMPVSVGEMGFDGDEHDYTFHGGVDKAIHAYCASHYSCWKSEFPDSSDLFVPGAFGENLVLGRMNERNVCIGDVVSVGPHVLLQVSLPRQPCFKLNHRFRIKNFAPNTWRLSRTGWYYRVLRPGQIGPGDTVRLVQRTHPEWTIERVQEYLHRNKDDAAMNEELAAIPEFGAECATAFKSRVEKHRARERKRKKRGEEDEGARAGAPDAEPPQWRDFSVVQRSRQTPRIVLLTLEAREKIQDAAMEPGSHVKLRLPGGLVRAYSVVAGDKNRFEIAVSRSENSRGGSRYLHEQAHPGSAALAVGRFTNGIPGDSGASSHVFVAGGVGLTAFLALAEAMLEINWSVALHYAVRSAEEVPLRERLAGLGDALMLYDGSKGQRLSVRELVRAAPWNSHLYFCGPRPMMEEALRETRARGVADTEVHFEAFEADASGDPFEATVASEGLTLPVGPDETLLEVLQKTFGAERVPSSCEVGNCATCKVAVKEGQVQHRGTALTELEKADSMLSCVSRGIGRIVIDI